jgi:hypothetical protein
MRESPGETKERRLLSGTFLTADKLRRIIDAMDNPMDRVLILTY